jgi:hypothetical protein
MMHSTLTKRIMDDIQQHNIALGSWVENAAQAITDQTTACLASQRTAAYADADALLASEVKEYYNSAAT